MSFGVVGAPAIRAALDGREPELLELVAEAYATLADGHGVNPPSTFLRFPQRPADRIIALPASLAGRFQVDGIKWISSVPGNVRRGLPRASGVLILNDPVTGVPIACLEAGQISAARTAASAALAARELHRGRRPAASVGFIGAGPISATVYRHLLANGWRFDRAGVFDLDPDRARRWAAAAGESVEVLPDLETAVGSADLVVFATSASGPYVHDGQWLSRAPVVLHLSLRDLAPSMLLGSQNIVDDVDHCLREMTSAHLAERVAGSRDFVTGTLVDVMAGRIVLAPDRPVIFSPFGLGVLDLALAWHVLRWAETDGTSHDLSDFFAVAEGTAASASIPSGV